MFCSLSTVTACLRRCGLTQASIRQRVQVYCPANSSSSVQVRSGYFPTGALGRRSGVALCPVGSYCSGGAVLPCASGRVGSTPGATNSLCDAVCPAGVSLWRPGNGTALGLRVLDWIHALYCVGAEWRKHARLGLVVRRLVLPWWYRDTTTMWQCYRVLSCWLRHSIDGIAGLLQ